MTLGLTRDRLVHALFGTALLLLPLAAIALIADLALGKAVQGTVTLMLINLIAVLGFGIYSGNTGIMSFGHVAFMNIGAHFSALLTLPPAQKAMQLPDLPALFANAQMGLLPAMILTLLACLPFAVLVGWPIARLSGASAIIATLALLGAVYSLSIGAVEFTKGSQALFGLPKLATLWVAFGFAALAILVARLFRDSRAGLEVQATREDERAASSIGIAIVPRRLLTWAISALVATAAGVLVGLFLTVFSSKEFYFTQTFALLAMLIVGGMASVSGAVLGTVLVTALIEILRRLEQGPQIGPLELPQIFGLTTLGLGICMIVVMIKRRDGLVGYREIESFLPRDGSIAEFLNRLSNRSTPMPASIRSTPMPTTIGSTPMPASMTTDPVASDGAPAHLSAQGVTKRYGGLTANQNVSISLGSGEVLGLIGPNGSGKTTLLNMLSSAIEPTEGKILLNGADVTAWPAHRMARNGVARTFQNIRLFQHLTVFENVYVAVMASKQGHSPDAAEERARALLAQFALTDQADSMAMNLPYGSQRRLEIARALATGPRLLLLDEPAAGMNEVESDALFHLLSDLRRDTGIGLLIVEHDLSLILRLCDRIVVLNKGEIIAAGSPEAIQNDPAVIEAYIGTKRSRRLATQTAP